jgi:hypothetical protein
LHTHIFYEEEDEKCGNEKVDERRKYFSIENSFVGKVGKFLYFQLFEKWIEDERGDEVFYDRFREVCDFFCDEKSYGYSEDVVGLDEENELASDVWVSVFH